MKKTILFFILAILLLPTVALAVDTANLAPEFNPLCWKEPECNAERKQISPGATGSGWIQGRPPCDKESWGMCLPSSATVTSIAFGGQTKFENIGDFIKYNYNLALGIAGILAAIMIAVAGIQWVTSGGNSEMITSAKKRIGGSIIGLVIAYLSFTILNTINPSLVNLTLPQAWMIRPFKIGPEWCRDSEAKSFMFAAANGTVLTPDKLAELIKTPKYDQVNKDKFMCGNQFLPDGSGQMTCKGSYCDTKGQICLPLTLKDGKIKNEASCQDGTFMAKFSINLGLMGTLKQAVKEAMPWYIPSGADVTQDWLADKFDLIPVCQGKDGTFPSYMHTQVGDGDGINGMRWSGDKDVSIVSNQGQPYKEYYVLFKHVPLSDTEIRSQAAWLEGGSYWNKAIGNEDTLNSLACDGVLNGKLVGYFLRTWFDIKNSPREATFFASSKKSDTFQSFDYNGFVTLDEIKKGIINSTIDAQALENMVNDKSTGVIIRDKSFY